MTLVLREACAKDARAIARLVGQLGYPASVSAMQRRLARLRASEADQVIVAELDGEVVGLAGLQTTFALEYDEPVAKLGAIVVAEGYRGRGIGQALVRAIEAAARHRGCRLLFLTTAERRSNAHAFYRRMVSSRRGSASPSGSIRTIPCSGTSPFQRHGRQCERRSRLTQ